MLSEQDYIFVNTSLLPMLRHLPAIRIAENRALTNKEMKKEMQATIRNAARSLYGFAAWTLRLPQATEMMFAARSSFGRSIKVFLFFVGVVLPLGSLIWALLFWHSSVMVKQEAVETLNHRV